MSYFDAYKKRLRVDNLADALKLDTMDNIRREFKNIIKLCNASILY